MICTKQSCSTCLNENICKHTFEVKNVIEEIDRLIIDKIIPLRLDLTCNYYQKKIEKQDGIYFR